MEGSFDEQWGTVKSAVTRHEHILFGNGQPGIVEFIHGLKAQFRLLVLLISVLGVMVTALGILVTIHMNSRGEINIPKMFSQHDSYPTDATSKAPTFITKE